MANLYKEITQPGFLFQLYSLRKSPGSLSINFQKNTKSWFWNNNLSQDNVEPISHALSLRLEAGSKPPTSFPPGIPVELFFLGREHEWNRPTKCEDGRNLNHWMGATWAPNSFSACSASFFLSQLIYDLLWLTCLPLSLFLFVGPHLFSSFMPSSFPLHV